MLFVRVESTSSQLGELIKHLQPVRGSANVHSDDRGQSDFIKVRSDTNRSISIAIVPQSTLMAYQLMSRGTPRWPDVRLE